MYLRDVLTSLTFRYISKYVTVLSATVFLLLGILYGYFSYNYFNDLSNSIVDELDTLVVIYEGQSLRGVRQYIDDQLNAPSLGRFYYLVTDDQGNKVAGDLPAAPRYREFSNGWLGFQVALLNWGQSTNVDFLARPQVLGDGLRALVARNYADAVERFSLVFSTLFRAMIATLILGIIGGFFSATFTLRRIERLNSELSRITRGNGSPGERLQVAGDKGYVRQLGQMMNGMLDEMAALMQGVRQVSDNIAHDLRTPLTRMRNNLSQLRLQVDPTGQREVDRILEECDDLLATFNALLRISTLESGGRPAPGAEVDLGSLLHDVVELYEPLAHDKGLELTLAIESGEHCRGDVDLLFQMLSNLLDNAIKYTPSGGVIQVQLRGLAGQGATILVADSGPGIAYADRKNVFRRFYRVESSRGERPGHGLGLALVQAIVGYHKGSIALAGNNPGLQVRVMLPPFPSAPDQDDR